MFNKYQIELHELEEQLQRLNKSYSNFQTLIPKKLNLQNRISELNAIIEQLGLELTDSKASFIISSAGTVKSTKDKKINVAIELSQCIKKDRWFGLSDKLFGSDEESSKQKTKRQTPEDILNDCISERNEKKRVLEGAIKAEIELPIIQNAINAVERKINSIKPKSEEVESLISKLASQYKSLEMALVRIQQEIMQLEKFNENLANSADSKSRREIHIQSEKDYGDGNPNKVLNTKHKELNKIIRDLDKIKTRIEDKLFLYEVKIKRLVIDGNNLCYVTGKFVGLRYLKILVNELAKTYTVDIIFDPGITGQLKQSQQDILSTFEQDNVACYFVSGGETADEYLLNYAAQHQNSFIISNDNFTDFKTDFSQIVERNVIKHLLFKDNIQVNKLNINIKLTSAE